MQLLQVNRGLIRKYPFEIKLITFRSNCSCLHSRQRYSCVNHVMLQENNFLGNRKNISKTKKPNSEKACGLVSESNAHSLE